MQIMHDFPFYMSAERKRYHKDNAPSDDIITLINLVRQNPVLYNYKLQPNQRRRVDVLNGWAEIADTIGNKYTVEECRRKWKNLRDTYHQYRLRKPNYIQGRLSKWRYAKELEFLSNVYQPKLKSQRNQGYDVVLKDSMFTIKENDDSMEEEVDEVDDDGQLVNNDTQLLSNDEAEAFILEAYEESVNDDVVTIIDQHHYSRQHPHTHQQHHVDDDDDDQINIKEEHISLDADDVNLDYEEVTLCEVPESESNGECDIGVDGSVGTTSPNSKSFHYIDANEFCMGPITANTTPTRSIPYVNSNTNNNLLNGANGSKLKNLTLVTPSSIPNSRQQTSAGGLLRETSTLNALSDASDLGPSTITTVATAEDVCMNALEDGTTDTYVTPAILQLPPLTTTGGANNISITSVGNSSPLSASTLSAICTQNGIIQLEDNSRPQVQSPKRDELDLFFNFLKKKIQCFSKSEITQIQVEFLNCVLRREASKPNKE